MRQKIAQDHKPIYLTSPNQKVIVTHKATSDKENFYGIFNIEATSKAAQNLSDRAFKLWTRMNLHQDTHRYGLSPVEVEKSFGITDKRYRSAVNELIEKGYLVRSEQQKNLFHFYEDPFGQMILPKLEDDTTQTTTLSAHMAGSSGGLGNMTRQNGIGNPAEVGREIIQNTTIDNKFDNTFNNLADGAKTTTNHSTSAPLKHDIPGTMFSAADMCDLFMQDHPFASGDRKDHNNSFSYDGSDNDLPF